MSDEVFDNDELSLPLTITVIEDSTEKEMEICVQVEHEGVQYLGLCEPGDDDYFFVKVSLDENDEMKLDSIDSEDLFNTLSKLVDAQEQINQ